MKEPVKADEGQPKSLASEKSDGMNQGMRVLSYLISGVLVYGLLGWLGDRFLGTQFLLPIGIVAGAAFGVYIIIQRFGRVDEQGQQPSRGAQVKPMTAAPARTAKEGEQ